MSCSSQQTKEEALNQQLLEAQQQEIQPDYSRAAKFNAQLGIHYTREGMLDFAKRKILKAESQDDSLAVVHYALGYYYQRSGNIAQADKAYQEALSISSNDPEAILYYAAFLCTKKDYDLAKSYFEKVLSLPENTILGQSYQAFAVCYKRQLDFAKAKSLFEQALKQNPNLPLTYLELAQINYIEKNYETADQLIRYYQSNYKQTVASLTLEMQIAEKLNEGDRAATLRLKIASM